MRQPGDLWLCVSVQELITAQTLCHKRSRAEWDRFLHSLEAPDTPGLCEVLLGLPGFRQHHKQCTTTEKSWGWTMEQPISKHFSLLPRLGDSRDPRVMDKNNCSPVIAAVQTCEIALGNPLGAARCLMSLALSGEAAASLWMPSVVSSCRHHRIFCRSGEKGLNEICGDRSLLHPTSPPAFIRDHEQTLWKTWTGPQPGSSPHCDSATQTSAGLQEEKDTALPCSYSLPWQNLCLSFSYHLLSSEASVLLLFREAALGMFMFTLVVHLGHCLKWGWGCKPPKIDIKYLLIQDDSLLSWLGGLSRVMENLNQVLQ